MADAKSFPLERSRSGSASRQRSCQVNVACLPAELAQIDFFAAQARLSRAAFMRRAALGTAGPRVRTRLPVDREALLLLRRDLAPVGSNLNQLARSANISGKLPDFEILADAIAGWNLIEARLLALLGVPT